MGCVTPAVAVTVDITVYSLFRWFDFVYWLTFGPPYITTFIPYDYPHVPTPGSWVPRCRLVTRHTRPFARLMAYRLLFLVVTFASSYLVTPRGYTRSMHTHLDWLHTAVRLRFRCLRLTVYRSAFTVCAYTFHYRLLYAPWLLLLGYCLPHGLFYLRLFAFAWFDLVCGSLLPLWVIPSDIALPLRLLVTHTFYTFLHVGCVLRGCCYRLHRPLFYVVWFHSILPFYSCYTVYTFNYPTFVVPLYFPGWFTTVATHFTRLPTHPDSFYTPHDLPRLHSLAFCTVYTVVAVCYVVDVRCCHTLAFPFFPHYLWDVFFVALLRLLSTAATTTVGWTVTTFEHLPRYSFGCYYLRLPYQRWLY